MLVVEKDANNELSSTMYTNSCMRQQISTERNVQISQFTAGFVKKLPRYAGNGDRVPNLSIQNFGYMYLAANDDFADVFREAIDDA